MRPRNLQTCCRVESLSRIKSSYLISSTRRKCERSRANTRWQCSQCSISESMLQSVHFDVDSDTAMGWREMTMKELCGKNHSSNTVHKFHHSGREVTLTAF